MARADVRRSNSCAGLSEEDFAELVAIAKLETGARTWLITTTEKLGGVASKALPKIVKRGIERALAPALTAANSAASRTHATSGNGWLDRVAAGASGQTFHKIAATVSGAAGGALGLATAAGDVLVSTTLVLRSVQEIARGYGADMSDPVARADCLSVLAMGGPSSEDDELDSAFWEMRAGLRIGITEASVTKAVEKGLKTDVAKRVLASKATVDILESAAFKKLVERLGINTQALLIQKAVPVLGGLAGAISNYQFMSYYQNMAHVMFRLRAVEARHEEGQVRSCYERVSAALRKNPKAF